MKLAFTLPWVWQVWYVEGCPDKGKPNTWQGKHHHQGNGDQQTNRGAVQAFRRTLTIVKSPRRVKKGEREEVTSQGIYQQKIGS